MASAVLSIRYLVVSWCCLGSVCTVFCFCRLLIASNAIHTPFIGFCIPPTTRSGIETSDGRWWHRNPCLRATGLVPTSSVRVRSFAPITSARGDSVIVQREPGRPGRLVLYAPRPLFGKYISLFFSSFFLQGGHQRSPGKYER